MFLEAMGTFSTTPFMWASGRMTRSLHGLGTQYFETGGTYYEGEWMEGRRHGRGTRHLLDGSMEMGEWYYGDLRAGTLLSASRYHAWRVRDGRVCEELLSEERTREAERMRREATQLHWEVEDVRLACAVPSE